MSNTDPFSNETGSTKSDWQLFLEYLDEFGEKEEFNADKFIERVRNFKRPPLTPIAMIVELNRAEYSELPWYNRVAGFMRAKNMK